MKMKMHHLKMAQDVIYVLMVAVLGEAGMGMGMGMGGMGGMGMGMGAIANADAVDGA